MTDSIIISQTAGVIVSIPQTPTYSSLVHHFRQFCYANKVEVELSVKIDTYGDAHPCVQVMSKDETLLTEAAILTEAWSKGELEK